MIGLIGPDGVGKSTLLGIIAGVRRIQTGERRRCWVANIADARFRNAVSARVAYLPQGLGKNLYPTLSIFENVDFFGRLFGQSREEREWRIEDFFASTDLTAVPRSSRRQTLRRDEAEAGTLLLADSRSGPAHPRRANHRRRSAGAQAILGADRSDPRPPPGHERDGRDRLHGRSREVRMAGRDERRQGARHRHAGRTQAQRPTKYARKSLHSASPGRIAPRSQRAGDYPVAIRAAALPAIEATA